VDAVCVVIAGIVRSALLADQFTLAWEHSVEKTRWEERYRVVANRLELTQARVQGFGAGMEPAAGAVLDNGWWQWNPKREPLAELKLAFSAYTRDYRLCWRERCAELADLLGAPPADGGPVELRACSEDSLADQQRR
jgi:hypothetical protein